MVWVGKALRFVEGFIGIRAAFVVLGWVVAVGLMALVVSVLLLPAILFDAGLIASADSLRVIQAAWIVALGTVIAAAIHRVLMMEVPAEEEV